MGHVGVGWLRQGRGGSCKGGVGLVVKGTKYWNLVELLLLYTRTGLRALCY